MLHNHNPFKYIVEYPSHAASGYLLLGSDRRKFDYFFIFVHVCLKFTKLLLR